MDGQTPETKAPQDRQNEKPDITSEAMTHENTLQPSPTFIDKINQSTAKEEAEQTASTASPSNGLDAVVVQSVTTDYMSTTDPSGTSPVVPNTPPASTQLANDSFEYISNPFLNATRGLIEVLQVNPGVSMLATVTFLIPLVILYAGLAVTSIIGAISKSPAIIIIGTISFFIGLLLYGLLVSGVIGAVASDSIDRERTTVGHLWHQAFSKFFPLLGLSVICGVISIIAYALLIIPGLLFTSRASLAFLLVFEEDLGPIQALKRSFALTKYHTFEMLASLVSTYLMTGGYLLLTTIAVSPFIGRYEDFRRVYDAGQPKQPIHWLNYLTAIFGSVGLVLFIGTYVVLIAIGAFSKNISSQNTATQNISSSVYPAAYVPAINVVNGAMGKALSVGNAYIQDMTDNNPEGSYALETIGSQELQAIDSAPQIESNYKSWNIAGYSGVLTNIAYVKGFSGEPAVSLLYTYNVPDGPFYVRLVVEYLNNHWAVDLVQGSLTKVFP